LRHYIKGFPLAVVEKHQYAFEVTNPAYFTQCQADISPVCIATCMAWLRG
jgi:hypothetical protein